ncbi:MAG: hypothetical protein AB9880_08345 [Christensenellales bacterium]
MDTTLKSHQIIPEVIADLVETRLGERISLLPVTTQDDSLSGKPGDTLKFPAFRYIGKALQVDENGQVQAGVLSADTVSATVRKYAKAVCITDEARLSGYGDPVGEAARQLALSIDHAVDDALFEVLKAAGYDRKSAVTGLSSEAVADALCLFGEDQEGDKVLLTDAEGFARLRKDPAYLRDSDLGQRMVFSGAVGEIWGCQILLSQKVRTDPLSHEKQHYILKPGALRLVNKTGTVIEVDREPEYMRDTIYCSKHCAAYLYDAGKLVTLCEYQGLETLDELSCGITLSPGGAGATRLDIPQAMQAPLHCKWVYTLSDSASHPAVFGTALSGSADYVNKATDIASGGLAYLHLALVGQGDMKPLKALSLSVVAG